MFQNHGQRLNRGPVCFSTTDRDPSRDCFRTMESTLSWVLIHSVHEQYAQLSAQGTSVEGSSFNKIPLFGTSCNITNTDPLSSAHSGNKHLLLFPLCTFFILKENTDSFENYEMVPGNDGRFPTFNPVNLREEPAKMPEAQQHACGTAHSSVLFQV